MSQPLNVFVIGGLLTLGHFPAAPVQRSQFSTCGWWQELNESQRLYKIGFAQGTVIGAMSDLLPTVAPESEAESALESMHQRGLMALLQKPALMEDAFNKVCGDYRNAQVRLNGVALIAALEIGGLAQQRAEAAVQLYRAEPVPNRGKVIAALSGK